MMGTKEKMINGDEYDALTRWKNVLHWKPGERRKIKQKFWKRVRHEIKELLKEDYVIS